MFLKKLKKLWTDVIGKVEGEVIIGIAKQVATKLTSTFPENGMRYLEIYKKILDTHMYYANISSKLCHAINIANNLQKNITSQNYYKIRLFWYIPLSLQNTPYSI